MRTFLNWYNHTLLDLNHKFQNESAQQYGAISKIRSSISNSIQMLSLSSVPSSLGGSDKSKKVIDYIPSTTNINIIDSHFNTFENKLKELDHKITMINMAVDDAYNNIKEDGSYEQSIYAIRKNLHTLHSNGSKLEAQLIKNFEQFQENVPNILLWYEESEQQVQQLCDLKTLESMDFANVIHQFGRVILEIKEIKDYLLQLQEELNFIKSLVEPATSLTKYAQGFEKCLEEIQRRQEYHRQIRDIVHVARAEFSALRDSEIISRMQFQESYGSSVIPNLMPFLKKSKEEERGIPELEVTMPAFDIDLPIDFDNDYSNNQDQSGELLRLRQQLELSRQENSQLRRILETKK